jgi:hypothetical protein
MCETPEVDVIEQLRDRLLQGRLADVTITYRVAGGMPADNRIDEQLNVSGTRATARVVQGAAREDASGAVAQAEFASVLQLIERDVDRLIPRSEASFLPDSTVGSITVGVGDAKTTYYFLVDEEAQQAQARAATPEPPSAVGTLDGMLRRLMREKGR